MSYRTQIHSLSWYFAVSLWLVSGGTSIRADEVTALSIPLSIKTSGAWTVVESPNFRCRCQLPEVDAKRLAECCETWRNRLRKTWIAADGDSIWQPKCDVCVHPDKTAYNLSLGRTGDVSVGSTMINFEQERAVLRRIDVRADAIDWSNAALPHELTHVVLAERFGGHALPRWADEGVAMLSESPEKHRERLLSLRDLLKRQQALRLDEMIRSNRIPAANLRDAFYGQSVALTSLLVRRSTPARFADFIEDSQKNGIAPALKRHYGLDGIAELQKEWDRMTSRPDSVELVSLQLHLGIVPIVAAIGDR